MDEFDGEIKTEILEITPTSIEETDKVTSLTLIPELSKKKYENAYKLFMDWRKVKKTTSFSENVLIAYFAENSKKYKSSTLWTQYSMLRTTLNINHDVDITRYIRLRAFLKRQSSGYKPKKSKTFTSSEINKFIKEAPNQEYLLTKTALIMGIMGACRRHELHQMKTTHLRDLGSAVIVTIPDRRNKIMRTFTVTGNYYEIIKQYSNLRPTNVPDNSFFLNYQKGKCTIQKVGINKFGVMGKQIAAYLKLPNPELYTGPCFRRSSATILMNAGGNLSSPKTRNGWTSATVAQAYIDETMEMENKFDVADKIQASIDNSPSAPSTSGCQSWENQNNLTFELTSTNFPKMIFNNCSNITFNIVKSKKNN